MLENSLMFKYIIKNYSCYSLYKSVYVIKSEMSEKKLVKD